MIGSFHRELYIDSCSTFLYDLMIKCNISGVEMSRNLKFSALLMTSKQCQIKTFAFVGGSREA